MAATVLPSCMAALMTPPRPPIAATARIDLIDLSDDFRQNARLWVWETARRFDDALVVTCHGTSEGGRWVVHPTGRPTMPVEQLVDEMRILEPTRLLVLAVCNPGGHPLDRPNVAYARESVWVTPDHAMHMRDIAEPDVVGSIFEMIMTSKE